MLCNRLHDLPPLLLLIDQVHLSKGLVNVWHSCNKGKALPKCAPLGFPVEWVSPTIMLVPLRPGFLQNFEKMDRPSVVLLSPERLREESKAHGIVRVCDRKPLRFPEKFSGRRDERLAEYHRGNRQ